MDTWPELSEAMEKISIVESIIRHLCQLAYQLGTDPRLWIVNKAIWNTGVPSYNVYPCHLQSL